MRRRVRRVELRRKGLRGADIETSGKRTRTGQLSVGARWLIR
jgi:hypothetical protein